MSQKLPPTLGVMEAARLYLPLLVKRDKTSEEKDGVRKFFEILDEVRSKCDGTTLPLLSELTDGLDKEAAGDVWAKNYEWDLRRLVRAEDDQSPSNWRGMALSTNTSVCLCLPVTFGSRLPTIHSLYFCPVMTSFCPQQIQSDRRSQGLGYIVFSPCITDCISLLAV